MSKKSIYSNSHILVTLSGIIITVAFIYILPQLVTPVFARAGGGESFGSGSFGYGGGTSGFGNFSGIFFLPFIFGNSGGNQTTLVVFIFVILIMVLRLFPILSKRHNNYGYSKAVPNLSLMKEVDLSGLIEKDADFSAQRFKDRVETTFFMIQSGWSQNDLSSIRGYITDSLYQRLQTQINNFKAENIVNITSQIAVGGVKIIQYENEKDYDSLKVGILASMIDYKLNTQSNKVVSGSTEIPTQFVEYWIFIRSKNTKTKNVDALTTKTCPNCGAPLQINEAGVCSYCKSNIISGDFDWVLSEITQTD